MSQVVQILSFVLGLVRIILDASSRSLVVFKVPKVVRLIVIREPSLSVSSSLLVGSLVGISLNADEAAISMIQIPEPITFVDRPILVNAGTKSCSLVVLILALSVSHRFYPDK